jgi:hypothetical protein
MLTAFRACPTHKGSSPPILFRVSVIPSVFSTTRFKPYRGVATSTGVGFGVVAFTVKIVAGHKVKRNVRVEHRTVHGASLRVAHVHVAAITLLSRSASCSRLCYFIGIWILHIIATHATSTLACLVARERLLMRDCTVQSCS